MYFVLKIFSRFKNTEEGALAKLGHSVVNWGHATSFLLSFVIMFFLFLLFYSGRKYCNRIFSGLPAFDGFTYYRDQRSRKTLFTKYLSVHVGVYSHYIMKKIYIMQRTEPNFRYIYIYIFDDDQKIQLEFGCLPE